MAAVVVDGADGRLPATALFGSVLDPYYGYCVAYVNAVIRPLTLAPSFPSPPLTTPPSIFYLRFSDVSATLFISRDYQMACHSCRIR